MNGASVLTLIYLFSFGAEPVQDLPLSEPTALSVDLKGNIYVADTGNNRIIKYNQNGDVLNAVGGFGWEKEQFDMPVDICAKSELDIFIADYNNERIERYDKDLNYISSYYSDDSKGENLTFGYPHGITISIHGELMIIDKENNRLLKINSFGEPEISFGDFSEGQGKLDDPFQIDISQDDRIYVSDKSTHRIVVFDYFGNYLTEIGTGILKSPLGIFYDEKNRLWVSDNGNKQIISFDSQGNILLKWNMITPEQGKLKNPIDIVTFQNKVYVLDSNRIHVFETMFNIDENKKSGIKP